MTIPESVEAFGMDMSLVYEWCVNRILTNIAKRFPYVTDDDARGSFEWQSAKLAEFGQVNQETMKIIRDSLKDVPENLRKALEAEIIAAIKTVEPDLTEAAKHNLLNDPSIVPPMSEAVQRELETYYRQAADKLNLVNTVMLDSTEQAYRGVVSDIAARIERSQQIIDNATGSVVTGVESLNSATRQAVNQMVTNGLTGFIDHAGRRWRPEAYVMMDVRTTMMNTARQAAFDRCDDFGSDIIQIDAHAGARPLCYPWQLKLISRSNNSRDVEDLYGTKVHVYALQETSYGEPAGLFGVNCRHFGTPFIPGFSGLGNPDLVQPKEENDKRYQATQEQRGLERAIRDARLRESIAKARGDKEQAAHWREKVVSLSDKIQAHCDEYGLPRQKEREYTPLNTKWPTDEKGPFKYNVEPYKGNAGNGNVDTAKDYFNKPEQTTAPQPKAEEKKTEPKKKEDTAKPSFTPAKTIAEAEAFARTVCDTDTIASYGISYAGVSIDTANMVNQRMFELFTTYRVEKFGGVIAPAGNTKLGKRMAGANAGFNRINRCFILNRKSCKTPQTMAEQLASEKRAVSDFLANPGAFRFTSKTAQQIYEKSRTSGRGTVPDTLIDVMNHEFGHTLEKQLRQLPNFKNIEANWQLYAEQVSGYATYELGEYIAESFASYCKGETLTDPELIAAFESLRR